MLPVYAAIQRCAAVIQASSRRLFPPLLCDQVVAAARGVPRPRQAVKVAASTLTVKDEQTQVAFPLATKFW